MEMIRICKECGVAKELHQYAKDNNRKDKLRTHCKKCESDRNKRWHETERAAAARVLSEISEGLPTAIANGSPRPPRGALSFVDATPDAAPGGRLSGRAYADPTAPTSKLPRVCRAIRERSCLQGLDSKRCWGVFIISDRGIVTHCVPCGVGTQITGKILDWRKLQRAKK